MKCIQCKTAAAEREKRRCRACAFKHAAAQRAYQARLRASGRCTGACGKPAVGGFLKCLGCIEKARDLRRGYVRPKPTKVIEPVAPAPKPQPSVPAKYQVICPKCKNLILPGSPIKKGITRWRHVVCPPKAERKSAAEIRRETALAWWEAEYQRCGRRN